MIEEKERFLSLARLREKFIPFLSPLCLAPWAGTCFIIPLVKARAQGHSKTNKAGKGKGCPYQRDQ
jgi:hypothetical protein